jgi:hypothetical protein
MYVDDVSLPQAREWEKNLQSSLHEPSLSAACREQAQMDLQDVQTHIASLTTSEMDATPTTSKN